VVESGLLALDWEEERKAKYVDDHGQGWDAHLADLRDYVAGSPQAATRR
jgi:hypothetical protein